MVNRFQPPNKIIFIYLLISLYKYIYYKFYIIFKIRAIRLKFYLILNCYTKIYFEENQLMAY